MGVDHRDADRQALPLRFGNGRRDAALGMLQRQVVDMAGVLIECLRASPERSKL